MNIKMDQRIICRQVSSWIAGLSFIWAICIACTDMGNKRAGNYLEAPYVISEQGTHAAGPFFTTDHQGFPIFVWSEKLEGGDETGYVVKFSKLSKAGDEIIYTREVPTSRGCTVANESMSKVAFKKDGTMVSVFSRLAPTETNRFSGALFYSQSFDNGATWSRESYLHVGDTTAGLSRGFFDIVSLPDGEVGAIWLDSRLTENRGDGSTLFFSKTEGDRGFLRDQAIGSRTCECCRTELFVSENGDIHILYRDIWRDSIRDISHIISRDNGDSFSQPVRISSDDWVIYGCPHTGPSMSESDDELNIIWFTMGGNAGLYQTRMAKNLQSYSKKELLTKNGSHPQILATSAGKMVYLWEENQNGGNHSSDMSHDAPLASINLTSFSPPQSVIKAQVWENNVVLREHWVSLPDQFARLPVGIRLLDDYMGVAWVQQNEDGSDSVVYRRLKG